MFQKNYTKKVVPLIKGHFHGSLSHYRYREAIRQVICWKTSCYSTRTNNYGDRFLATATVIQIGKTCIIYRDYSSSSLRSTA